MAEGGSLERQSNLNLDHALLAILNKQIVRLYSLLYLDVAFPSHLLYNTSTIIPYHTYDVVIREQALSVVVLSLKIKRLENHRVQTRFRFFGRHYSI